LIVGIHDDVTVNKYKGSNFPIMNLHERVLCVLACKHVDEVVIGAPWVVTQDLLTSLNVSLVVQGTITKLDLSIHRKRSLEYLEDEDPYSLPKNHEQYVEVPSESQLQTSDIIQRIIDNRLKHLHRFEKTHAKEENYYTRVKHFVEEG
jgi:ethanolamine-phosphate cytidylyltransferase